MKKYKRKRLNKFAVLVTLLSFWSSIAIAQIPLPLDRAVNYEKLDNGFTYYIRENNHPENRATLYLVCKAGSILETDDQQGLAHFMEHMSFNGTKNFPKNTLVEYLQKSGVRFGADLNAATTFDNTVYQLPIPTDDTDLYENGLQIMRDWAQDATLDTDEINAERGVILEEMRLNKGVSQRLQEKYLPVLLNHSRYADRLPIGKKEILVNFKPEAIKRFYRDWYRPDLQALVVVGDIDVANTEKMVKELFGDLKMPQNPKERKDYTITLNGKNQFIAITDEELTQFSVMIAYKHPKLVIKTSEDYRESILRLLFNTMLSARLGELSQKPNPPFMGANARLSGFMGGLDMFSIQVEAEPQKLSEGFDEIWQEIARIKRDGFTKSEFNRAKINYLSSFKTMVKEKDKRSSASYAEEYEAHFLQGIAAPGIDREYQLVKKSLNDIHLNEFKKLINELMPNKNRDIIVMAPEAKKDSLPSEQTIEQWMEKAEQSDLLTYIDPAAGIMLMEHEPVAGTVINEDSISGIDVTTMTLSNGVKVYLKSTNYQNNQIIFTAYSAGGTSLYSDKDYQSIANATNILSASGLGNHTLVQLSKLLSGKQISVSPFIGELGEGISGSSTYEDLDTALKLVHLYFTKPRKDTTVFSNIINRSKTVIANRYASPQNVFADTIAAIISNNNPRKTGPTLEKLNAIDLDKAYKFYKERFADASDFNFFFVGNFKSDSIRPLLEKYIGSLPSSYSKEQFNDLDIHIPEGHIEKTVYKGFEDKATVQLIISGNYKYTRKNNLKINALSEILQFHLIERLREQEGGVYTPSVKSSTTKYPANRYGFYISFGCSPANVDKLVDATLDEIKKLKQDGPSDEDFTKYINEAKRQAEIGMKTNGFWLSYLSGHAENHEDLKQILEEKSLLDKLSKKDIKKAAKRFVDTKNFAKFVLMPEIAK